MLDDQRIPIKNIVYESLLITYPYIINSASRYLQSQFYLHRDSKFSSGHGEIPLSTCFGPEFLSSDPNITLSTTNMDSFWDTISELESAFEDHASRYEKWQLIAGTVVGTLLAVAIKDIYFNFPDIVDATKSRVFKFFRSIPPIRRYIEDQLETSRKEIEKGMLEDTQAGITVPPMLKLPSHGYSREEVSKLANDILGGGKFHWKDGKISGGAFAGAEDGYSEMLTKTYGIYALTNPLHADVFPGVRKMEAEIVSMTLDIFHGHGQHCGTLTSGGSESILMACKAMRDWGREEKGVESPEIVMCITGHSGFDKAASMLGMKVRKVRANPLTWKADLGALKRAITSNTVMLVASAPQFPHGIIDDTEAIAHLGRKYNIPVHVDCCMGGFLLPFMEAAGYPLPPFDFRVPGVTSISADTHKYGNAPKGSSVIMYSDPKYRHCQYFVTPDWTGGIYASPTVPGSRPGGLVAVCWAALLYHGKSGYIEATRKIVATARSLKRLIEDVPELQLMGDPLASIVAFTSTQVDILKVGDLMTQYGWHLNFCQYPPGLHICLTTLQSTDKFAEGLVSDLKKAVKNVKEMRGEITGLGKVYGTAAGIPDKSLVGDAAKIFLACYYESMPKDDSASTEAEKVSNGIPNGVHK
ncbi:Sphingosine-1-phosphate lyase 1 [Halocaridina rubra]|uniref:sphinganine-1-phosphate aldolase n=1 Tax=Halocaridina rubra TaxID=373956 RepID=A0AAN8XMD8_HALRR